VPAKMKVILPKKLLAEPQKLARAIENALDGAAEATREDFLVTTQTWSNEGGKPKFGVRRKTGERVVYTQSKKYLFVTGGTRPHLIRARRGKALAFSSQHQPKTQPRVIGSGPGSRGPRDTFRKVVKHPGTKAREFEKEIGEKWRSALPITMQRAIDSEV
jgi:hypothetical protein